MGRAYAGGARAFDILALGRLVIFVVQIYAFGLVATKRDNQFLLATLAAAVTSVTLGLLFIPHFGIVGAACCKLLSDLLVVSSCYVIMRRFVIGSRPFAGG